MKKILLTILIFISGLSIAYAQCTVPTSVVITEPSIMSICEGTALTLSANATVPSTAANGNFTYSWKKVLPTPPVTLVVPTDIILPVGTATSIPSYSINSASMTDAGTYVLRIEDGSVGN